MRNKDFRVIQLGQLTAFLLFALWMFIETDLNIQLMAGGAMFGALVCFTGTTLYEFIVIMSKHN